MADHDPYHSTDYVTGYPQLPFVYQYTVSDSTHSDDPYSGYDFMQSSRHQGTGYVSEQAYSTTAATATNNNTPPRAANPPLSPMWSHIYGIAFAAALFIAGISALAVVTAMSLPKVQVDSISVSSFNVSESQITADWNINFHMISKWIENYDHVEVFVYYKDEFISGTVLGPIQLHPNKPKLLQANVIASSKKIRLSVANAILSDNKHGSVGFDLKLSFTVKGTDRVTWDSAGASCGSKSSSKCDVYCREYSIGFTR